MPVEFTGGPVMGKSTARRRHFFPCHPSSILSGIHFWTARQSTTTPL